MSVPEMYVHKYTRSLCGEYHYNQSIRKFLGQKNISLKQKTYIIQIRNFMYQTFNTIHQLALLSELRFIITGLQHNPSEE